MKKLFTLLILSILTFSFGVLAQEKSSSLMPGGTEYVAMANQDIQLQNQEQVHMVFASARENRQESRLYIPSDWSPQVAIPFAALLPLRQRNSNYNRTLNVNITPSTYPGAQLNYFNRAIGQHPLTMPFMLARSNP